MASVTMETLGMKWWSSTGGVNVETGGEAGHSWESQVDKLADVVCQGGGGGVSGGQV